MNGFARLFGLDNSVRGLQPESRDGLNVRTDSDQTLQGPEQCAVCSVQQVKIAVAQPM